LKNEGPGHGDGGHGSGEGEGGDDDHLVPGRHLLDPVEHRGVIAQRGAGVDHREDRRFGVEDDWVDTAGDAGHLHGVEVALSAEAVDKRWLVREGDHVVGGVEVPHRWVEVHRFHRVAGEGVDGVEHVAELEQIAVVLPVAVTPVAAQAGDERWAGHRGVGDPVAA